MTTISKADLLKKRLFGVDDVEIPGVGIVKVRPLSRSEVLELEGKEMSAAEAEQKLVAKAMVEPKLTEAEVAEWQASSPAGELKPVNDAICRMSGIQVNNAAAKEAVKQFRN